MLLPGDPAPSFQVSSTVNPDFYFDTTAGRYIVLSFFASSKLPFAQALLDEVSRRRERFDVNNVVFFGVSADPEDRNRLVQEFPGVVYFWDFDLAVSRLYGVVGNRSEKWVPMGEVHRGRGARPESKDATSPPAHEPGADSEARIPGGNGDDATTAAQHDEKKTLYSAQTLVLDPGMRVIGTFGFGGDPVAHLQAIFDVIDSLPRAEALGGPAPVLTIPYVFEPELCKRLIDYYNARGGTESGFMRDVGGKTVPVLDAGHKRRKDCDICDDELIEATQERLRRRVVPAIQRAFQFSVTHVERAIVACYDAADGGHFRAHRDNTTLGTAHRRFAVTINLNSDDFEGGGLWFPEFSRRIYRPATRGAVVFSCSLLHEATKVTKGKRYAFLPFLYDAAAAKVRERNLKHIAHAPPNRKVDPPERPSLSNADAVVRMGDANGGS